MEYHDVQIWELSIDVADDGDVLLRSGRCPSCQEDSFIRLHRTQIPLVAEAGGFVPAGDVVKATERLQDRLDLLISLVRAHTQAGDPLRIVVDDLATTGRHESPVQTSQS